MDPRTKLAITFLYAISLFLCKDWIMILAATAFLCIYVAVSRVPRWRGSSVPKVRNTLLRTGMC